MNQSIKTRVLLKFLLAVAVISIVLAFSAICPAFADAPPFGIFLDDMWAYESEELQLAYSFSPIPSYVVNRYEGPAMVLAQGTKFDYYFSNDVEISKILDWETYEMTSVHKTRGDGNYTFNTPGFYSISFQGKSIFAVEVKGTATSMPVTASQDEIKVMLNGKLLNFDVPPQIINGRTLVPLRVIFEALGASVDWNDSTQTVTAARGSTTVSLRIGSNVLTKNSASITLDVPAQLIDSRTMVPARAVAEAFGADVDWVDATQTVIITTGSTTGNTTGSTADHTTGGSSISGQITQSTLAGTYWKAVSTIGEGSPYQIDGDDWADLFLWEDGTGYFRIGQATAESSYWGMREVNDCNWVVRNGTLSLSDPGQSAKEIGTGTLEQGRLAITYEGYYSDSPYVVIMEQASMPTYGYQWELPELYGHWRMISYSDSDGDHNVRNLPNNSRPEIVIHSTLTAYFYMNNDRADIQVEEDLGIVLRDGPIWKNAVNQAWHAELKGSNNPKVTFLVSFAEDKLLFKLDNSTYSDIVYPDSFSAEFEYVGSSYDFFD